MSDVKIIVNLYELICGDTSIKYVPWWEKDANVKVMGTLLSNELRIDKAFFGKLSNEDLFMLKFLFNNAYFRPQDSILFASHIIFFKDNLDDIIKKNRGRQIRINFHNDVKYHSPLIALVDKITSKYPNVHINKSLGIDCVSYYRRVRLKYLYPLAILGQYFFESVLSAFSNIGKNHHLNKKIIFSNFRHYTKSDNNNVFWGNFIKLLLKNNDPKFNIIYYNSPMSISWNYYIKQFLDKQHLFLTDYVDMRDFFFNLYKYFKYRKNSSMRIQYIYDNEDYGEFLSPSIELFFYVFYPLWLKNRAALNKLNRSNKIFFTDSELNILALQLGFTRNRSKLIVLTNEIVSEIYAALPWKKGRARPSFDLKIVHNHQSLNMLSNQFHYPKNSMKIFPDPRFLTGVLESYPVRSNIVFISQTFVSFYHFANLFNRLFRRSRIFGEFQLIFKPHPWESITRDKVLDKDISLCTDKMLSYIPKYAVNASSTLGLELLFNGTIVFFLDNLEFGIGNYFGIKKHLSFLVCNSEKEVLDKILKLEKNAAFRNRLLKDIRKFMLDQYAIKKRDVLVSDFKSIFQEI